MRNYFLTAYILALPLTVNSALLERLGGLAYYDDVANLTWLADANAAGVAMNWVDANSWAASLSVDGISGWRLPDTMQPDSSCSSQLDGGENGLQGQGYNCTGSELGNMFYNVLGGESYSYIDDVHNSNYDFFTNVQNFYWSGTERADGTTSAWILRMDGDQRSFNKTEADSIFAWAVQTGDVSAVPVPASVWLFGSGLLGLVGVARRKKV